MSGAPGTHPHHSLPARPPTGPGAPGSSKAGASLYSNYYANSKYPQQTPAQGESYGPSIPAGYQAPTTYGAQAPTTYGPQAPTTYGPQAPAVAPLIRNPFPPGSSSSTYGWQSGYGSQPSAGPTAPAYPSYGHSYGGYGPSYPEGPASTNKTGHTGTTPASGDGAGKDKQKTVYRSGGGKQWADDTLLEWDPSHPRLFVGNLAGEVTDEILLKAFSKWKSVQKALVKRDKWTNKSRGYGFVSFSDAEDFFQSAKEMNGKYIGSHPVVVRKSTTEIKVSNFKDDARRKKNKGKADKDKKKEGAHASGSGAGGGRRDESAALRAHGAGIVKPGKTKNGLKLLG